MTTLDIFGGDFCNEKLKTNMQPFVKFSGSFYDAVTRLYRIKWLDDR